MGRFKTTEERTRKIMAKKEARKQQRSLLEKLRQQDKASLSPDYVHTPDPTPGGSNGV